MKEIPLYSLFEAEGINIDSIDTAKEPSHKSRPQWAFIRPDGGVIRFTTVGDVALTEAQSKRVNAIVQDFFEKT